MHFKINNHTLTLAATENSRREELRILSPSWCFCHRVGTNPLLAPTFAAINAQNTKHTYRDDIIARGRARCRPPCRPQPPQPQPQPRTQGRRTSTLPQL